MSTNHHPPPIKFSTANSQNTTMSTCSFSYPDIISHRISSHPLTNGDSPQMNSNIQPNNPQHPSQKFHASQSTTSMSYQSAPRNLSQLCDFQDFQLTITQLQSLNKSQSEQITELKIRVAVLENELSHTKRDKDAVSNSLGIVIESLTRFHHSTSTSASAGLPQSLKEEVGLGVYLGDQGGKIKELEKEIEQIRKENRCLRRREKEFGYAPLRVGEYEREEHHVRFQSGMPLQGSSGDKGKGKERMQGSFEHGNGPTPEQLIGSWGNPPSFQHSGADGLTSSQLIGSWGNPEPSFGLGEPGPSKFNNSFASGSTTAPNTPILNATNFASFADVGLHSLEENMDMDNDGFPPALSFPSSTSNSKSNININSNGGEEEKDIDEQLLDQQATMSKFMAMPKPNILRVGFEVEGTKRGPDYDANPLKPSSYQRNGSMRTYDRFGNNTPPSGPRSMTELKIPSDLSRDENLWDGKEERKDAVEIHMRSISSRARDSEMRFPEFFRYGILYQPSSTDSNYLRTVMLTNLPVGTELRDVLARVRGGEILSASLLDTRSITGALSARVVFRHEGAAEEYVLYAKGHPILFGDEDGGKEAKVTLLTTPTYPPSPRLLNRLLSHQQTRCLSLPNFPPHFSLTALERQLASNNGVRGSMLIEFFIDEEGTLHLQFSDIFWAGAAFGILTNFRDYRGLDVKFVEDPCTGPLSDLSSPIAPRPPMLPKNWDVLQKQYAENNHSLDIGGVGGGFLAEQRRRFAALEGKDGEVVREVEGLQRKRLLALSNQKVEIPSFSGQGITGESWADEVIEELDSETPPSLPTPSSPSGLGVTVPPNSPIQNGEGEVEGGIGAILIENVNEMMFQGENGWWRDQGLKEKPVGLAGSKYARLVTSFSDGSARPRLGSRSPNSHSSISPLLLDNSTSDPEIEAANTANGEVEEQSSDDNLPTLHDIAKQRLQILSNQAPLPPLITTNLTLTSFNPKPLNKTPPRVNLHDLLASSPSSSSISSNASSPPLKSHLRKENGGEVIRMPKGPRRNGFAKIKRYDSLEAETDEVNLKMPSEQLALDGIGEMSPVSEGVMNPDEIELSDGEDDGVMGKRMRSRKLKIWLRKS
jgi:hypothetical protein